MSALPRLAWIEIDLDALVSNLAALRAAAGPGVRVEPVVKADAYGHGSIPVALALARAAVDGLSVAAFDEALELRTAGYEGPILVLYQVPPELIAEAAARAIVVSIGSRRSLERILEAARSVPAEDRPLAVQLEIETGLGRGGVEPSEIVEAASRIAAQPAVRLDGVWSHLAAPEDVRRTDAQLVRFEAALSALDQAGLAPGLRHLVASGGLLCSVPHYDAVRPGLALYGIVPEDIPAGHRSEVLAAALRPVLSLVARPVRVADLPAGWGISYGPSFETSRPSRIATLPLGYGDGWPRLTSNRAEALVRGKRVPLVGTVSMDAVMADVTDVPGAPVDEDDEFVLIGAQGDEAITAVDLARSRTTISWEVVTAMARRLPRVYHAAAGPSGVRTLTAWESQWRASNSGTATSATSRST